MRRSLTLAAVALLAAVSIACGTGKGPTPQPSPSAPTWQAIAKLLDRDAASDPQGKPAAPLPQWRGDARAFAEGTANTLWVIVWAPFQATGIDLGYVLVQLQDTASYKCGTTTYTANSQPVVCEARKTILFTAGNVVGVAPADRMMAFAQASYAFGTATAMRVTAITHAKISAATSNLVARCIAGSMIGSLQAASKLGGSQPAADVERFIADFGNILVPVDQRDTASVRYGVEHHTIGACMAHFHP